MKVLAFRFSALGDVALTVPALSAVTALYGRAEITFVTHPKFVPLLKNIKNVTPVGVDFDNEYKGYFGLRRLHKELQKKYGPFEAVVDLHGNLRTSVLKSFFRFSKVWRATINKDSSAKKALTAKKDKNLQELTHTVDRYLAVLRRVGLNTEAEEAPYLFPDEQAEKEAVEFLEKNGINQKLNPTVGIAPFTQHFTKNWGIEKFTTLIQKINENGKVNIILFGGGKDEEKQLQKIQTESPDNVISAAGVMSLEGEIALISQLDVMITQDSANMHLAAIVNTPTISIWGGTHPYAGFGPFGSKEHEIIQIDPKKLPCRPCSVHGREDCFIGDKSCMEQITVDLVYQKLAQKIAQRKPKE